MRIDIITVLPELIKSPFEASILKRATEKGLVEVHFHNLREYASNKYRQIDDYQFGGGAGMVMMIEKNLIMLCGHYKGVDQRVRDQFITREISIGDYVLSGGELGAAVLSDAIIRLLPGVLNDETSALTDSFQDNLLAPPVYTRPAEYKGWKVPA